MSTYSTYRFTWFAALLGLVFSILSVITKASYSFSVFLFFTVPSFGRCGFHAYSFLKRVVRLKKWRFF